MPETDRKYLHALNLVPGIGADKLRKLADAFGSMEAAWSDASPRALADAGLHEKTVTELLAARERIRPDQEWERLEQESIGIIAFPDERYPKLLREIRTAPYLLYERGLPLPWQDKTFITVVGTRHMTEYGKAATRRLVEGLTQAGSVVASGLALGIDAMAHQAAIESGGETIAILGGGIGETHIQPRTNLPLAHTIMRHGALVSEYPPDSEPTAGTFPARKRIMAGMAVGTIVIEAGGRSGTLITARLALDFDREVFAVPGSIFSPYSEGPHALLKGGAKLAGSIEDILEELRPHTASLFGSESLIPEPLPDLPPDETTISRLLSHEPIHIDLAIKRSGLAAPEASAALMMLEMKGIARNIGGQRYIRGK